MARILYGIYQTRNKPKVDRMNIVPWILWFFLDGSGYYGTDAQGDDLTLMGTFLLGTVVVCLALLWRGRFSWTNVETFTLVLVIACVTIAKFATPKVTIWATGVAIFCAGIPLLNDLRILSPVSLSIKMYGSAFFCALCCATAATYLEGQQLIIPFSGVVYWFIGNHFIFKEERLMVH